METPTTGARRGPKPNLQTRDNLIRAGMKMLHTGGYTATGIKDIVDAVSVPKGSFYNYFPTKEAFGQEVIDAFFERGLPSLNELLSNPEVPPLERLHTYFHTRITGFKTQGYTKGCLLGNLSLEVGDQSPAMRERIAEHFRTWSALLEQCIEQAQSSGAVRNPLPAATLAQFLLNSWEGALLRMRVEKSDAPLNDFAEVVFGSLLV